jgi:hypothetical protein
VEALKLRLAVLRGAVSRVETELAELHARSVAGPTNQTTTTES